jgi:hypothetical protein
MDTKTKVVLVRFVRAFIAGAVSTMALITINDVSNWTDLAYAINALIISGVVGGINGFLLAVDKLVRWKK